MHVFASSKKVRAERLCHTPTSTPTCSRLVYHVHEIRAKSQENSMQSGGGVGGVNTTLDGVNMDFSVKE